MDVLHLTDFAEIDRKLMSPPISHFLRNASPHVPRVCADSVTSRAHNRRNKRKQTRKTPPEGKAALKKKALDPKQHRLTQWFK